MAGFGRAPRGDRDPWARVGTLEVTTTLVVAVLGVVGMFVWAASASAFESLVLVPRWVRAGEIWRVATWPMANPADFGRVISIAMLWWFGTAIERLLGRRRYLVWLLVITMLPALVFALLPTNEALAGLDTVSVLLFVAFVIEYPGAKFFFGIPAWALALVSVGLRLLQLTGNRMWWTLGLFVAQLLLVATGLRAFGLAAEFSQLPALPLLNRLAGGRATKRSARVRVPGQQQRSTRPQRPAGGPQRRRPADPARGTVVQGPWESRPPVPQSEVDRLLDKIASHGMESLTPDERLSLEQASRHLRDRKPD